MFKRRTVNKGTPPPHRKTRINRGFSLAEMMVVMLILSIVMAAMTPIITKRSKVTASGGTTDLGGVNNAIANLQANDTALQIAANSAIQACKEAAHGTKTFINNGTWIVPSFVTSVTVTMQGGGGGGGGGGRVTPNQTNWGSAGGGGGSSGGLIIATIPVTPGTSMPVVIGRGGGGGGGNIWNQSKSNAVIDSPGAGGSPGGATGATGTTGTGNRTGVYDPNWNMQNYGNGGSGGGGGGASSFGGIIAGGGGGGGGATGERGDTKSGNGAMGRTGGASVSYNFTSGGAGGDGALGTAGATYENGKNGGFGTASTGGAGGNGGYYPNTLNRGGGGGGGAGMPYYDGNINLDYSTQGVGNGGAESGYPVILASDWRARTSSGGLGSHGGKGGDGYVILEW